MQSCPLGDAQHRPARSLLWECDGPQAEVHDGALACGLFCEGLNVSTLQRYILFFLGILVQAAGITLLVKSLLGTSPISTTPYAMSLILPYTFGQTTLMVNMLFVLGEILLLRRKFHAVQLMQVPITFVFTIFIDFFMAILFHTVPEFYPWRMLILLSGTALIALGVALQVIANVLMLPGEGFVYAISQAFCIEFGKVKTWFDCILVATGATLCLLFLPSIEGIREGTLISALITGSIARWFIRHLSYVDATGAVQFRCFGGGK